MPCLTRTRIPQLCTLWGQRVLFAALILACLPRSVRAQEDRLPNIVYIMADELAYYELGHMGNPFIKTPRIDQMAREGLRFTRAMAGSPVCASLRCALMTGKHMGHASVRGNGPACSLRADEQTLAAALKSAGYATGGFGKWGIGGRGSEGVPEDHGFDDFFGYYDQVHAHTYFPPYLIRQSREVELPGNSGGRQGPIYSHYEIMREALAFIRAHQSEPFFCYLPITPPHGNFDIPNDDPAWSHYENESWIKAPGLSEDVKNYAAMVTMVDRNVGQVLDLLAELGLQDDTIVFFTGDNGGQDRFRSQDHPRGFFGPNVNPHTKVAFRGGKGNLYEGGLRIPFIAHWPGRIPAGQTTDLRIYHPDVFPTLVELTGSASPDGLDGISFLPTLIGADHAGHAQETHPFFYWEHRAQTAVLIREWKGIRPKANSDWELYDLASDPSESRDLSTSHPELVKQMIDISEREHTPLQAGRYADRTLHERDRAAKFGFK